MSIPIKDVFDRIFFRKAVPPIRLARLRPLDEGDLPDLPKTSDPAEVPDELLHVSVASGVALLLGIAKVLRRRLAVSMFLALLFACSILAGPVLVYVLVDFVREAAAGRVDIVRGITAGFLLCLSSGVTGLLQHHYFYNCLKITQTIVSALNIRIFRQGLLLTRKSRMNRQTGDIVNLLGTDTDILSFAQFETTELIMRIFVVFCAAIMLIYLLGLAGLLGLLTLILVVPLAKRVAKNYLRLDDEIMAHRDKRVSLMSSILSGIRIVKYFAWEKEMRKEVDRIRQQEIGARRKLFNNTGGSTFLYFCGSLLVGTVAFLSAIALGRDLNTPTLFAALALFGVLEGTIGVMSDLISIIASGKVSADRIASFLRDPHFAESMIADKGESLGLQLKDFSAKFEDAEDLVLKGLNLTIRGGESVAVIGPVGSGKTALLLALMNEIPGAGGEIVWEGLERGLRPSIGFVPQEALIMNGTLRENIELGLEEDDEQLAQAIRTAALEHDIQLLSGGLLAEIGEQGINLSGGQKQRVNLARAARRNANIMLLDDPISAVDAHTEAVLMSQLLFGLWKDKTRIVVTHRLHHLKDFDRILFLQDGEIIGNGTYDELNEHNAAFRIFRQRSEANHGDLENSAPPPLVKEAAKTESVRITDEEQRSLGSVGLSVYATYAKALLGEKRLLGVLLIGFMSLMAVGTPVLQQSWLAYWSDHSRDLALNLSGAIGVWTALGVISVISAVLFQRLWLMRAQRAGQTLHDGALLALMKSPLNYFDRTPIGRILNRFSRDMDSLEREIATNLERTIGPILHTLAAVTILLITVPLLGFIVIPAFIAYYALQRVYRSASRDAQRLTSMARSPRFAFFKEAMQAATLIRVHGQTDVFLLRYEGLLRSFQRRFHGSIVFNRWFSSRIPMLGAAISFGLIASILWLSQSGSITAGAAGLSLVYALRLCDHLNNAIRSFTVVESNMIGVERLNEIQDLPGEKEPSPLSALPSECEWPLEGSIAFDQVSVRYAAHLPLVLKSCDFEIQARQKVGIIGRTGAGKSTLFQVLYRFVPPTEGRVLIDGIDAATIPLDRLRRALAIIPQDPVLFQGTLRSNLDRFEAFSDEKIWTALRRSHLEAWVKSLPEGLLTEIKETGSNFSQGQRQQLCLARALLLDTKIIVLDEATASVDVVTDGLIQETLRDECKDKTVLIIAHRLETLSLCDRVLEMRDGSPHFIR